MSSVHAEMGAPGHHQPLVRGREQCESKRPLKKESHMGLWKHEAE